MVIKVLPRDQICLNAHSLIDLNYVILPGLWANIAKIVSVKISKRIYLDIWWLDTILTHNTLINVKSLDKAFILLLNNLQRRFLVCTLLFGSSARILIQFKKGVIYSYIHFFCFRFDVNVCWKQSCNYINEAGKTPCFLGHKIAWNVLINAAVMKCPKTKLDHLRKLLRLRQMEIRTLIIFSHLCQLLLVRIHIII